MRTITFGQIPDNFRIDEPYEMDLNKSDFEIVAEIINQGIDGYLEAVFFERKGNKIIILDTASMKCFIRRCIESENEEAEQLASCIMSTLGIEWI